MDTRIDIPLRRGQNHPSIEWPWTEQRLCIVMVWFNASAGEAAGMMADYDCCVRLTDVVRDCVPSAPAPVSSRVCMHMYLDNAEFHMDWACEKRVNPLLVLFCIVLDCMSAESLPLWCTIPSCDCCRRRG